MDKGIFKHRRGKRIASVQNLDDALVTYMDRGNGKHVVSLFLTKENTTTLEKFPTKGEAWDTIRSFLDKYPDCKGCPHTKYCGLMVSSIKLCNSYGKE